MSETTRVAPPAGAFQVTSGDHTLIHTPNVGRGIAHHYSMWHDPSDTQVGQLHQHTDGEVSSVEVHPQHRRQGVATKMWSMVEGLSKQVPGIPAPKHSTARTASGDKFAKSIGGELPKRSPVSASQFQNSRWD